MSENAETYFFNRYLHCHQLDRSREHEPLACAMALDPDGDKRQVAVAHHSSRRAFETMYVSIIVDGGTPFDKKLLLVNSRGDRKTLPLLGTSAWLTRASSHPEDAQPSFAENSVCIRRPDSMTTWIVASPTAEDQRSFLDRLRLAGCTLRDLADHFELLPEADQPTGGILRLGRQTTTRRGATANRIVALKVANGEKKMSQLLNEAKVLQNLHHDGIMRAYGIYEVRFQGKKSLGMVLWALKEE